MLVIVALEVCYLLLTVEAAPAPASTGPPTFGGSSEDNLNSSGEQQSDSDCDLDVAIPPARPEVRVRLVLLYLDFPALKLNTPQDIAWKYEPLVFFNI